MTDMPSQAITTIGTFLTLTSLLGTFFYVQLTNWLRDLLSLRSKFDFNKGGNQEDEKKAIREVRYTLASLYNTLPFLVAIAISCFIGFAAWNALEILGPYRSTDQLAEKMAMALILFLVIYAALVAFLLGRGYWIGFNIKKQLK